MDQSEKTTTVDWMKVLSWVDKNKKRLITWTAATVIVVSAITLFIYYENQKEVRASKALSDIVVPLNPSEPLPEGTVEALLSLERDHPNTKAAARAVVMAAGVLFGQGRYNEAQELFSRFERQYPESTWLPQAMLGHAATIEVQGNTDQALIAYETLRKRYPNDAIADEVKLGLARLYEKQNRPAEALALYQDILRVNPAAYSSIGAQAGTRQEMLLQKYPDLMKTNAPPPLTATNLALSPKPATNRTQTITLTNLVPSTNAPTPTVQITNRPGTNVPLMIQPGTPTSAPPAAPK